MTLCLYDLPPQNSQLLSYDEESMRRVPAEGHPAKCLSSTPRKCQGHQKQGEVDNCQSQEKPKETGKSKTVLKNTAFFKKKFPTECLFNRIKVNFDLNL